MLLFSATEIWGRHRSNLPPDIHGVSAVTRHRAIRPNYSSTPEQGRCVGGVCASVASAVIHLSTFLVENVLVSPSRTLISYLAGPRDGAALSLER